MSVVLIPGLTVLEDPLLESLTNEGIDHVAEVLAGHFANLLHNGQSIDDSTTPKPQNPVNMGKYSR